jgi:hypothetical protein
MENLVVKLAWTCFLSLCSTLDAELSFFLALLYLSAMFLLRVT